VKKVEAGWECGTHGGYTCTYRVLVRKREGKRLIRRCMHNWRIILKSIVK